MAFTTGLSDGVKGRFQAGRDGRGQIVQVGRAAVGAVSGDRFPHPLEDGTAVRHYTVGREALADSLQHGVLEEFIDAG